MTQNSPTDRRQPFCEAPDSPCDTEATCHNFQICSSVDSDCLETNLRYQQNTLISFANEYSELARLLDHVINAKIDPFLDNTFSEESFQKEPTLEHSHQPEQTVITCKDNLAILELVKSMFKGQKEYDIALVELGPLVTNEILIKNLVKCFMCNDNTKCARSDIPAALKLPLPEFLAELKAKKMLNSSKQKRRNNCLKSIFPKLLKKHGLSLLRVGLIINPCNLTATHIEALFKHKILAEIMEVEFSDWNGLLEYINSHFERSFNRLFNSWVEKIETAAVEAKLPPGEWELDKKRLPKIKMPLTPLDADYAIKQLFYLFQKSKTS